MADKTEIVVQWTAISLCKAGPQRAGVASEDDIRVLYAYWQLSPHSALMQLVMVTGSTVLVQLMLPLWPLLQPPHPLLQQRSLLPQLPQLLPQPQPRPPQLLKHKVKAPLLSSFNPPGPVAPVERVEVTPQPNICANSSPGPSVADDGEAQRRAGP